MYFSSNVRATVLQKQLALVPNLPPASQVAHGIIGSHSLFVSPAHDYVQTVATDTFRKTNWNQMNPDRRYVYLREATLLSHESHNRKKIRSQNKFENK